MRQTAGEANSMGTLDMFLHSFDVFHLNKQVNKSKNLFTRMGYFKTCFKKWDLLCETNTLLHKKTRDMKIDLYTSI